MIRVFWKNVTDAGPVGWLLLFLLATSVVLALAALLVAVVRPRNVEGDPVRVVALAAATSLGLGLVSAFLIAWLTQQSLLAATAPTDDYWFDLSVGTHVLEAIFLVVGQTLVAVGALCALSAAVHTVRSPPPKGTPRPLLQFVPLVAGLVLGVTGIGFLRRADAVNHSEVWSLVISSVGEVLDTTAPVVAAARMHLLAAALLGSAVLVLAVLRNPNRPKASPAAERAAFVVFAIGLASFLATRPLAWDAAAPIPPPESPLLHCRGAFNDAASFPQFAACKRSCSGRPYNEVGPLVRLSPRGVSLDHTRITTPDELAANLAEREKDRDETRPGPTPALILAIPGATPTADLAPWLDAIHRSYPVTSIMVGKPQTPVETTTAGTLSRFPRCCCTGVSLGTGSGRGLSSYSTWDDIARAAMSAPEGAPLDLPIGDAAP